MRYIKHKKEKNMNWAEYETKFEEVLDGTNRNDPYDQKVYQEYVKLNQSRISRWLKKDIMTAEMKDVVDSITSPQKWVLITEPWCGDAAHSTPAINMITELSDKVELEVQLRDVDSEIDNYLTNGGKSIPMLIVRDENGKDLFTWGARPKACQDMVIEMKTMDLSLQDKNMRIQQWYNKDKGVTIQKELAELLKNK